MRCLSGRNQRAWGPCWRSETGPNLKSSGAAVPYAEQHEWIYASVGIHPHEARHATDAHYAELTGWLGIRA